MRKPLQRLFVLFFIPVFCFANSHGHPQKSNTKNHREKAVLTKQNIIRYPVKRKELEVERKRKELASKEKKLAQKEQALKLKEQALSSLTYTQLDSDTQQLLSQTQFMCICPNAHEFLAALRGLSSNLKEYTIPPDCADHLLGVLYPNKAKEWSTAITTAKTSYEISEGLQDATFPPICFFRRNKQILCLAWCGQGSVSATAFYEKSAIFNNLKHVLICGICACPLQEFDVGSVFFSQKYVKLSSCTIGDLLSAQSKGKTEKIYLRGAMSYFTDPKILSCNNIGTFLSSLTSFLKELSYTITPATNFSFDFFIDDKVLAQDTASKAGKDSVSIIDMEGASLADLFSSRGCTVHSLRTVSDHAGLSIGEIKTGRPKALDVLTKVLPYTVDFWMENVSTKDMFCEEKMTGETTIPQNEISSWRLPRY